MGPGVGGRLQWTVVVGGQASLVPTTSYRAPVVADIGLWEPSGVTFAAEAVERLSTRGGQVLVFRGRYFGLRQAVSRYPLPVSAVGRRLDGAGTVTAVNCTVTVDDVELQCVTPSGVGRAHAWTVTVAGQASAPTARTTSYEPPVIVGVSVVGKSFLFGCVACVPFPLTRSFVSTTWRVQIGNVCWQCAHSPHGSTVVWRGTGPSLHRLCGCCVQCARCYATLLWAGLSSVNTRPGPEDGFAVPTAGGATVTFAGTGFGDKSSAVRVTWAGNVVIGSVVSEPHVAISFPSQPGQGPGVPLVLSVGGQSVEFVTGGAGASIPLALRFRAPRVASLALDRSLVNNGTLDCSAPNAVGVPQTGTPGASTVLVVSGADLGSGFDAGVPTITVHGAVCEVQPGSTHTTALCRTRLCFGACLHACLRVAREKVRKGTFVRPGRSCLSHARVRCCISTAVLCPSAS
jgi:hypothetical protein